MKKEYISIFALFLVGLAHVIDFISGRIPLIVKNPYQFISMPMITKFPLTSLGIFCRSIGLFIIVWMIFSLIANYFFQKAMVLLTIFILSNLYAIQQLATGVRITTVQWTLSIAYGSILLLLPCVLYILKSTTTAVVNKVIPQKVTLVENTKSDDEESNE